MKDRAEALSRQISSSDKTKLDEYLTSVREVEKRVDGMRKVKDKADDQAKLSNRPVFTMQRPADGLPEDLRDHTRLMCDIIAIAFQTDRTRVACSYWRAIFRRCTIRSSTSRKDTTAPRTITIPTVTSASAFPLEPVGLPGRQVG